MPILARLSPTGQVLTPAQSQTGGAVSQLSQSPTTGEMPIQMQPAPNAPAFYKLPNPFVPEPDVREFVWDPILRIYTLPPERLRGFVTHKDRDDGACFETSTGREYNAAELFNLNGRAVKDGECINVTLYDFPLAIKTNLERIQKQGENEGILLPLNTLASGGLLFGLDWLTTRPEIQALQRARQRYLERPPNTPREVNEVLDALVRQMYIVMPPAQVCEKWTIQVPNGVHAFLANMSKDLGEGAQSRLAAIALCASVCNQLETFDYDYNGMKEAVYGFLRTAKYKAQVIDLAFEDFAVP
jgi:hypothetical protein